MSDGLREARIAAQEAEEERRLFIWMHKTLSRFGVNNWTESDLSKLRQCGKVVEEIKRGWR